VLLVWLFFSFHVDTPVEVNVTLDPQGIISNCLTLFADDRAVNLRAAKELLDSPHGDCELNKVANEHGQHSDW
jgi:hypothetical protein